MPPCPFGPTYLGVLEPWCCCLCADGAPCRRPTYHLAGSHSRLPLLQLAAPPHRRSRRSWPRSSMWSYSSVRRRVRTARRHVQGPRSRSNSPYPVQRSSSPSLSVAPLVLRSAFPPCPAPELIFRGSSAKSAAKLGGPTQSSSTTLAHGLDQVLYWRLLAL